jgi:hypothetical protein
MTTRQHVAPSSLFQDLLQRHPLVFELFDLEEPHLIELFLRNPGPLEFLDQLLLLLLVRGDAKTFNGGGPCGVSTWTRGSPARGGLS